MHCLDPVHPGRFTAAGTGILLSTLPIKIEKLSCSFPPFGPLSEERSVSPAEFSGCGS